MIVTFDGEGVSSQHLDLLSALGGIYLYRIDAGSFSQSRTMMLLK